MARLQSVKSRLHSASAQKICEVLTHNHGETGGLAGVLDIEAEARIMLILNVDLHDRLVSGQLGVVKRVNKHKRQHHEGSKSRV